MDSATRQAIIAYHQKGTKSFWHMAGAIVLFFSLSAASVVTWEMGWWPVTLLIVAIHANVAHINLLAFHESSHYILHPHRLANEAKGILVGTFILTPLSVYRWVHNQHHLYLGTEKDSEQWPFVLPGTPRSARILAAIGELCFGFFYTPVVFLHGYLTETRMPAGVVRRIRWEYGLCVLFWTVVLTITAAMGWWKYLLLGYLIPAILAGNIQSLRKFTEHMGMLGDSVPTMTRTVLPTGRIGRFLSWAMMHIDLHGIHHRYAKIPQYNLPAASPLVYPQGEETAGVFPSYLAAMWDMFKSLGNPRVGAQWLRRQQLNSEPAPVERTSAAVTAS